MHIRTVSSLEFDLSLGKVDLMRWRQRTSLLKVRLSSTQEDVARYSRFLDLVLRQGELEAVAAASWKGHASALEHHSLELQDSLRSRMHEARSLAAEVASLEAALAERESMLAEAQRAERAVHAEVARTAERAAQREERLTGQLAAAMERAALAEQTALGARERAAMVEHTLTQVRADKGSEDAHLANASQVGGAGVMVWEEWSARSACHSAEMRSIHARLCWLGQAGIALIICCTATHGSVLKHLPLPLPAGQAGGGAAVEERR